MTTFPKGIRPERGTGFRVFVRRNGTLRTQRFPAGTTLTELKAARERLLATIILQGQQDPSYLALVNEMVACQARAHEIGIMLRHLVVPGART